MRRVCGLRVLRREGPNANTGQTLGGNGLPSLGTPSVQGLAAWSKAAPWSCLCVFDVSCQGSLVCVWDAC